MAERIELVFGIEATLSLSYIVLREFGYLQNMGTSLLSFDPNSGLRKIS